MNGKDILLGMSFISDELVQEADSQPIKKAILWKKWLPLAACLCLIIGAAGLFSALMPGMDNSMPESAALDNELAAGGQNSVMEAGQENGAATLWNFAVAEEAVHHASGGLSTTQSDSIPESNNPLRLYMEKTESPLLPTGNLTAGQTLYQPDSWESTWISSTEVQLFLADSGTLLARFIISRSETEHYLITAVSDSLAEDHFLQAITEIIENPEVLP